MVEKSMETLAMAERNIGMLLAFGENGINVAISDLLQDTLLLHRAYASGIGLLRLLHAPLAYAVPGHTAIAMLEDEEEGEEEVSN